MGIPFGCGLGPGAVHRKALRSAQQREEAWASPSIPDPTEEEDQQRPQTRHHGGPTHAGCQGDLLRGDTHILPVTLIWKWHTTLLNSSVMSSSHYMTFSQSELLCGSHTKDFSPGGIPWRAIMKNVWEVKEEMIYRTFGTKILAVFFVSEMDVHQKQVVDFVCFLLSSNMMCTCMHIYIYTPYFVVF